jgi:hypothetical protein
MKVVDRPTPSGSDLLEASIVCLRRQLSLVPVTNPFHAFRARFAEDLEWLMNEPIETFHQYSFASLRQYGACFELVETYLRWLAPHVGPGLEPSIQAFHDLSATAKAFQFQLARAMVRKRELSLESIDRMGELWYQGLEPLIARYT